MPIETLITRFSDVNSETFQDPASKAHSEGLSVKDIFSLNKFSPYLKKSQDAFFAKIWSVVSFLFQLLFCNKKEIANDPSKVAGKLPIEADDNERLQKLKKRQSFNVLVVEDSLVSQKIMIDKILKAKASTNVYVVDNVSDAVNAISQKPFEALQATKTSKKNVIISDRNYVPFQLVLMDRQIFMTRGKDLNGNGGLIATKEIRKVNQDIPIFSVSANPLSSEDLECGYTGDWTKTFTKEHVKQFLAKRKT